MAYCPLSGLPVFDQGYPVDGALLYAFDAGTTTPRTLYLTADINPAKVHPVPVTVSDGVLPVMFAGPGSYDILLCTPDGGQIRRISGLAGDPTTATPSGAFDPLAQFQTGDIKHAHRTGAMAGWVRCNGLTIGSGASAGTERANDDCHALFVYLWTYDTSLTVSSGRSPTGAEADWQAGKTIALPNDQNRLDIGCGDMGNAAAAVSIANATAPNGTVLGATGGEAAHTLTTAEMGSATTVTTAGTTQVLAVTGAAAHNNLPPFVARTRYIKL